MEPAFDHFSFFSLRAAPRPITYLRDLITQGQRRGGIDADRLLLQLLDQPWAKESLFLASPGLLTNWMDATTAGAKLTTPVSKALWRYMFRSYSRSTPFGLFAGLGIGLIESQSRMTFGAAPWKAVSRPDITLLLDLITLLTNDPSTQTQLSYRLNNSLYVVGNSYRFSEQIGQQETAEIVLSSVNKTDQVTSFIDQLAPLQSYSYAQLIQLSQHSNVDSALVDALIDAHVLTSSLVPAVTGEGMHKAFLNQLESMGGLEPWVNVLKTAQNSLNQSVDLSTLIAVQSALEGLRINSVKTGQPSGPLIQTDLYFKPETLSLSETLVNQIAQQYQTVLPVIRSTDIPPLTNFIDNFRNRFGDHTIPLLIALDPEVGVGYNTDGWAKYPLLSALDKPDELPFQGGPNPMDDLRQTLYKRFVLSKLSQVEITSRDIEQLIPKSNQKALPPCWFVHGELYEKLRLINDDAEQSMKESSETSDWRFLINPSVGTSPAAVFGRFCQGLPELKSVVVAMCAWEQSQYPDEILAEFVHLPAQPHRSGNIIDRPVLRPVELPYLNASGVSAEQTVLLSDLHVRIAAENEVILLHKRTGQRVRPRHSSAHNALRGDEVYQFLAHLQQAESITHYWGWGSFEPMPFLPRIVFKNLIISPSRWTLERESLTGSLQQSITDLRQLYQLPRYVQLIEGDSKLLLDLEFEPTQQILLDEMKKRKVVLYEWLSDQFQPWAKQGTNDYESEIIIPFKTLNATVKPIHSSISLPIQHKFYPGQEWLYLKIYCNEIVADMLLRDFFHPLSNKIRKETWSDKQFFVRYTDPNFHLRIRFHCVHEQQESVLRTIFPYLETYVRDGFVERYQIDTYDRETERYGPELIDDCEILFDSDSQMVCSFLATTQQPTDLVRYAFAMGSIDQLYTDFNLSLNDKAELSSNAQKTFWQEDGGSKNVKRQLNDFYRLHLPALLEDVSRYESLLKQRSSSAKQAILNINALRMADRTPHGFAQLVGDINHMNLNRLFTGENRRHEMVVYHFLARYYASQLARRHAQA